MRAMLFQNYIIHEARVLNIGSTPFRTHGVYYHFLTIKIRENQNELKKL